MGKGDISKEVVEHTAEGAPSKPPTEALLETLSSTTIRVSLSGMDIKNNKILSDGCIREKINLNEY